MQAPSFDEQTFLRFFRTLDERQARLCAAERALALGWGGITRLARVTGLSRETVRKGRAGPRLRRPGGGRKKVEAREPAVLATLQEVVEASTAGRMYPTHSLTAAGASCGAAWRSQASACSARADPDYRRRAEPTDTVEALRQLP